MMENNYLDNQNICSVDKCFTILQSLTNGNERIIIFKNNVSSSSDSFEIKYKKELGNEGTNN